MTKDEALKMAIEQLWACSMLMNLDHSDYLYEDVIQALDACKEALEQPAQERNFCSRCGKRASKDPNHIHTCTPPQALEQPAQEPNCYGDGNVYRGLRSEDSKVKTYHVNTHPHHWQGLTDDEIRNIDVDTRHFMVFARAIEQALKEKNHGL